jgi:hypothetical protein
VVMSPLILLILSLIKRNGILSFFSCFLSQNPGSRAPSTCRGQRLRTPGGAAKKSNI